MMLGLMIKTPDDVLDYDIDFSRWLPVGDRITAITASLEDATTGSTIAIDSSSYADTSVKVWLSGGALGDGAAVVIEASTDGGRTKEVRFRLRIKECS